MRPSPETSEDRGLHQFGTGPRRVLALHCSLSHGGSWRGMAARLTSNLTLIAPDLPGHGKAPDWDGVQDYQDACLGAVRPLLDKPMDVIGHSFGAVVALRLAVEYPALVRSLCLMEPVFFAAARKDDLQAYTDFERLSAGLNDALEADDRVNASAIFNDIWGDGRSWDTVSTKAQSYMAYRVHLIHAQNGSLADDRAGILAQHRLENISAPVLMIRGSKSPQIIRSVHRGLTKRLPSCREDIVAEAGHMLPVTHPHEVASSIDSFFKSN